jgi:ABC-type Na+ transport system ATPase subunit NatA
MEEKNKLQIESKKTSIANLQREAVDVDKQKPVIKAKIDLLDKEAKLLTDRAEIILGNYKYLGEIKWAFEEIDAYKELQRQIEQVGFEKQKLQLEEQRNQLVGHLSRIEEQQVSIAKELSRLQDEVEKLEKGE